MLVSCSKSGKFTVGKSGFIPTTSNKTSQPSAYFIIFTKVSKLSSPVKSLVRRTSLFKTADKGFYVFVVGNMFGDPVERSFLMNLQQSAFSS